MIKTGGLFIAAIALGGCALHTPMSENGSNAAVQPAQTEAKSASATATVSSGDRREVKGRDDWTGYIQGKPGANDKFAKLQIGMGQREVVNLAGPPTDEGSHVTGKAFIPFYYGAGRYETAYYYKNVGRLYFSGKGGFATGSALIGIEYDANEKGYQ